MKIALAGVLAIALAGCSLEPTKVVETEKRELIQVTEKAQKPLDLANDDLVVLDARSSFDYGLDRVRNSLSFQWESLAEDAHTGELLRDKTQAAMRLSLLGITPQTPILIVGYGPLGQAEEGRLAWNLLYLGFQDVQVSAVSALRKSMTQEISIPRQNVPRWQVNLRDEMQIDRSHFLGLMREAKSNARVVLIDVRSEKEYLSEGGKNSPLPNVPSFNIEWKQLFTAVGRPDLHFKKKLLALGIQPSDRVITISNRGVRSAAAAYALIAMGYPQVQNFTAGRNSLQGL